ncbi:DUF4430 domain-containing protein [Lentibacillus sp. Marseille-P4043]|uniref:DUF4430 domain-containing protein n=1 Tax=Lentibacillus sp. Marseille-P4043 TaxID=2040293 RepID=UPI000D0B3A84|nr:DUF4430 domain-containing protein [Lentibacillus sp. Marseille-P4043]
MRKSLFTLASFIVIIGLLTGCGDSDEQEKQATSNDNQTEQQSNSEGEESEDTVTITISKDKETEYIDEKDVAIEDGANLMDVMEENFTIETDFDGAYITSIEGVAQDKGEQTAWMFFVNGETAMEGAKDIELSPGDEVSFDLQKWE